ncbi:hypothetical protein BE11_01010 [Sorangium cellulosum]|nr:hypothetical protein BE11_01010 [Sorangium cellulosum]
MWRTAGGLATGPPSLLAARVLAGAFGGPATSIAFSIVADAIPPAPRAWRTAEASTPGPGRRRAGGTIAGSSWSSDLTPSSPTSCTC